MTRAIRLTSTLVLGALFVVILLHLSFKAHVFELLSTGFAVSSLENSVASPWYAFLLHGIHFSSSESDLFVVIDLAADTRKFIDVNLVWYDVFTSPITLTALATLLTIIFYLLKAECRYRNQDRDVDKINNDVHNILTRLEVDSAPLHHKSPLAGLSHSIHDLSSHLARVKRHSESQTFQDKLTKLIDRHAYIDHIEVKLKQAELNQAKCGLLFIDLDGFKQVNDSFGHSFGDEILIQVALRLSKVVRQFGLEDTHPIYGLEQNLSRLGGDEFSIFIPTLPNPNLCTEIAQSILCDIERDFLLGNKLVKIGASIGIAVYPDSAATPNSLLQMADVAMYRAKSDGRGIFKVYSPEMGSKMRRYHYLLEELRLAIAAQSFYLSFQPIVHVEDCAIDYFEALIRWNHPIEGLIPPAEFIPIAEESNLILELGDWILLESCRQMSAWHNAGMKKVKISVNVSGIQLKHRKIFEWVNTALEKTGLPASALMLEITESTLIKASNETISQLQQCRDAGISVAIDDFGTGFSSLSTLADLPIDVIKIDKLFITQANSNPKYRKILNSISELGQQLELKVVAEGVEQIEQFELVKNLGISCVQGYLVSRPESSNNVGSKVLNGNVNHIAATGTSIWLPEHVG
ncbi:EAL domain-containing protein [Pseudoalteromonas sp. McH1-7]|uniref:putative bifunctional diguanylate cyclase/phosphodiesterase n=1 Tax=Pseudoalteromonas TaxID=53246 RepID=UPI00159046A0|nr:MULTISPECIES: EAL domain-containing protein [Pseudoalteromonas]MDW7548563.1 EAL domain-containing protein [Pseudoalteromonas peptidolytica]NUZ10105.1 EAL domain-containing protein [Pseudoalteromonas sp. McH1-7]USD30694.1 EAL domain-containing protein [Pseudoalteromonas sp. SCSIO 43201]